MKGRKYIKSPELFKGFIERLLSKNTSVERPRSGFEFLDSSTNLFRPGSLAVLGGALRVGKSAIMLCVLRTGIMGTHGIMGTVTIVF